MNARLVRGTLAAAVAVVITSGFAAPALAEPSQFCVSLSNDRQGYCIETDWLPASVPTSPR